MIFWTAHSLYFVKLSYEGALYIYLKTLAVTWLIYILTPE